MIKYFYKTIEMNGSNYMQILLRSSTFWNIENDDNYCLLGSKIANLHPCKDCHPNRVSNYRKDFHEIKFQGFNFQKGFKGSDVHRFENLNNFVY